MRAILAGLGASENQGTLFELGPHKDKSFGVHIGVLQQNFPVPIMRIILCEV